MNVPKEPVEPTTIMDHSSTDQSLRGDSSSSPTPPSSVVSSGDKPVTKPAAARGKHWFLFNFVGPVGILAAGILIFLAFGQQIPPVKPPADASYAGKVEALPGVETLPVRSLADVGGKLDLTVDGEVVPYREVTLATEVAGQIVYKDPLCKVGSFVEENQLLIRIDPTDYEKDIQRLTRMKEQDYQAIRELDQEAANIQRLLEVAKQDLELQERDVARVRALPPGVASQAEIDNVQRARLQALNAKLNLENQLATLKSRRVRLEAAEALAETQLEVAQINLARTEIRAPVSGVIYREDAELNSFVQRGQVVVTVEDISKAEVVINLRTDQLFWVLSQQPDVETLPTQLTSQTRSESESPVDGQQDMGGEAESQGSSSKQVMSELPVDRAAQSYELPPISASVDYQIAGRENEFYRWEGHLSRYDGLGVDPASRTVPVRVVVDAPRKSRIISRGDSDAESRSSRMALVRGMFARVTLHVHPNRPLVVLPAVSLKPGSAGSRVWKFAADSAVIEGATSSPSSAKTGELLKTVEEVPKTEEISEGATATFDPSLWVVGRIDVIDHVRPIEAMTLVLSENVDGPLAVGPNGQAVYWVCEVGEGDLQPGDRLVVSPLPSFEGGGKDAIRIRNSQPVAAESSPSIDAPNSSR